jgi:hypothetical protein
VILYFQSSLNRRITRVLKSGANEAYDAQAFNLTEDFSSLILDELAADGWDQNLVPDSYFCCIAADGCFHT